MSKPALLASESMTRDVIVVSPSQSLRTAWRVMSSENIRHLPVVRAGALVGMLSDRDVLRHGTVDVEGFFVLPADVLVTSAMTPTPLETCDETTSVSDLARLMVERKIDAVPVVCGLRLVGLVTGTDLIRLLIRDDEARALPFSFRLVEDGQAYGVAD